MDVAVIRLPKISNFTDFIVLEAIEGVSVRYVGSPQELGRPDLIILPGTKATIADLRWLRESGLEATILRAASGGAPVLGICGGYQMLGLSVSDPAGMEGGGEVAGLGLLPVRTVFGEQKRMTQSEGVVGTVGGVLAGLSGQRVRGYEVHMGQTIREGGTPLLELAGMEGMPLLDGCQSGNVYGCYLHGLFDSAGVGQALVAALLAEKGLDIGAVQAVDMDAYRQQQYDLLAEGIRQGMDIDLVRSIIEEGL